MDRRRFMAASATAPLASRAPGAAAASNERTLRVAVPSPNIGFDPAQVQDLYSSQIISHIFDAPLRYDNMARPTRLVPNTTVGLPAVSSDFRTFTRRIRPGIGFQDDPAFKNQQRELVADGYVYSIKRVFDLADGPNLGSSNDARLALKACDDLYAQQRRQPDGLERLALLREASRLLVACMPDKFMAHRIRLDLSQRWVHSVRRALFKARLWAYLDIDLAMRRG